MVKSKKFDKTFQEEVFVAFGSNVGNRYDNIKKAIRELERLKVKVKDVSSFYKSWPYPGSSGPYYLNAVARIFTTLDHFELLNNLKIIEKKLGRDINKKEKIWGEPRPIDIDIIFYGNRIISKKNFIEIPHKALHKRDFVLKPLAEIAPEKVHPVLKKTVSEILADLKSDNRTIFGKLDRTYQTKN